MTRLMLPAPDEPDNDHRDADRGHSNSGPQWAAGSSHQQIPDEQSCLLALASIARLLALGYINPATANSLRSIYRELLQYHQRTATRHEQGGLSAETIRELMQRDPHLLNLLEPLLSGADIDAIRARMREQDGGQA